MFKRAPLLVTDFSDLSEFTLVDATTGAGFANALSSKDNEGLGIFLGDDSVRMTLNADAANDEAQLRWDCFVPPDRSDRFYIRFFQDIAIQSDIHTESWNIELFVSNTANDVTNGIRARFLHNTPSKQLGEHLILSRSDFDATVGSGIDWTQPIRCMRFTLRKSTDAGLARVYLDACFAGWELFQVPIAFSCDDNSNDNTTGDATYGDSYGQYTYLWKDVFEPRDWRISLCSTVNLVGGGNSMTITELAEMHRAGCDVIFAGEDHLDHRTTAEGGAYADEAALRASIVNYNAWAVANGFTRARESQWAALPFGAYGPTIYDLFDEYGIKYNRMAGGGHITKNQYQYTPWFADGFRPFLSQEIVSLGLGFGLQETAAAVMTLVSDAIAKQAGMCFHIHKIADTIGSNSNYFPRAQADILWPLLDIQEAAGRIKVCQLTEINLIQGGDPTSRHNRARKAGTGRR